LIHDVVLTFQLPTDTSASQSASVINELKIAKYIGSDNIHVRQAVVIHSDSKPSSSQCTLAVWTSNDDLCILYFTFDIAIFVNVTVKLLT